MELDHILVTDLEVWVDCGRLALWQTKKRKKVHSAAHRGVLTDNTRKRWLGIEPATSHA